jgi:hypothetical protein
MKKENTKQKYKFKNKSQELRIYGRRERTKERTPLQILRLSKEKRNSY